MNSFVPIHLLRTLAARTAGTFSRQGLYFVVLLGFAEVLTFAQGEAVPRKQFDVPAGKAEETLQVFSRQAGVELVYTLEKIEGVQTASVKGELPARDALAAMVAGTDLKVVQDTRTGALALRRESSGKNESSRRAGSVAARVVQLDKVEVAERRVDGLINRGLLQGGAEAPLFHSVIQRAEIERLGVTSMEELFRLIPQTSSPVTGLQSSDTYANVSGGVSTSYSTTSLRGFASTQTVVLINGRAMPRSSRAASGGADLGRIPIAAIERIEIMPYSGSAIYGAGAIGGAINIILRKNYSGRDLTTYFGTSTEGGGTEYRVTYLEGMTLNEGRTNLTLTLNYQNREPVRANQRDFIDELVKRYPVGTANYLTYVLPALSSSPAVLYTTNTAGLGIPGAESARFAMVPKGTSAAQSLVLTPSSFTATANTTSPTGRYGRAVLYIPQESISANAQIEHKFFDEKLEGYAELTYTKNKRDYSFPQSLSLSLTATDPLNPFRTGVVPGFAGRAVSVYLDTTDLGDSRAVFDYETMRAVMGLQGKPSERWSWSLDASVDWNDSTVMSDNVGQNLLLLNSLTLNTTPGPAASVDVRRALYPVLADHMAFPTAPGNLDKYFHNVRNSYGKNTQYEYNGRVTATLFDLPAGPFETSVFAKYRTYRLKGGQFFTGSEDLARLVYNSTFPVSTSGGIGARDIWQTAVEAAIPVISRKWRPLPVQALYFNLSGGYQTDESTGVADSTGLDYNAIKTSSKTYVAALKLEVTDDLAFRASYTDAFYPADWNDTGDRVSLQGPITLAITDPKRGNTTATQTIYYLNGGNPGLLPESAKSTVFGVIAKPRFLPRFTLTADYWSIEKKNAIALISFTEIIARPDDFPGRITRGTPTAAEAAMGWAGPITQVDQTRQNVGLTKTDGVDTRIDYELRTESAGNFNVSVNSTFTNHFRTQQSTSRPFVEASNASGPVRWRGYASVTWNKARFGTTLTTKYVGHYSTNTTAPSAIYPNATGIDGAKVPAIMRYDLQFTFDVPEAQSTGSWRSWLAGTRWTLGCLNVFNEKPDFLTNGSSYYNRYEDVRQRYLYTSFRKSF